MVLLLIIIIKCSGMGELSGKAGKGKANVIIASGQTLATNSFLTRFFKKDSLAERADTLGGGGVSFPGATCPLNGLVSPPGLAAAGLVGRELYLLCLLRICLRLQ